MNRQVLIFSPVGTFHSNRYVQFVTSEWQDSNLSGVSIGHFQSINSEQTDNQVPFLYCYVQFATSERYDSEFGGL